MAREIETPEPETTPEVDESVAVETPEPEPDGATSKKEDAAADEEEFEFVGKNGKTMRYTAKQIAERLENHDALQSQLGTEQNRRATAERERDELRGAATKASSRDRNPEADEPLEDDDLKITEEDLGDTERLLGKFDKLVKAVKSKGSAPVDVEAKTEAILEKRELFATDERLKRMDPADREIFLRNAIDYGIRSNAVKGTAFRTYQECVDAYYDALSGTVTPKEADESQPRFVRQLRKTPAKGLDSTGEGASDDIVSKAMSLVKDPVALSGYLAQLKPEQREKVLATFRGKSKVPGMVD